MKKILFFLILSILVLGESKHDINDIKFLNYSVKDGLSQSTVRTIVQGKKGYLWIGTSGGLNRYDGENFEAYYHQRKNENSLYDSLIRKLHVDKNGNLWVGTRKGLNKYNYSKNNFDRISEISIRDIYEDNLDNIWIGADSGLYKLENKKLFKIKELDKTEVYSIARKSDKLYLGTENGVLSYDLNSKKENKRYENIKTRVNAIYIDTKGNMWIGSQKRWFKHDNFGNFLFKGDAQDTEIFSFTEDSKGIMWIGTGFGLIKHTGKSRNYFRYQNIESDPYSLSNDRISCVYEDRDKNLWVGNLRTGGLDKITKFKYNRPTSGINKMSKGNIWAVHDTGNKIWIGTSNGISIYLKDKNRYTNILKDKSIWSFEVVGPYIWVGTWGDGLYRVNRKTYDLKNYNYEGYTNKITTIKKIDNFLWLGTYGDGLWRFNLKNQDLQIYSKENGIHKIHDDYIWDIELGEDNHIWVGSEDNGFSKFNYKTGNMEIYNSENSNLSKNSAWVVKKIEDKVWVGTWGGGLNILDLKTQKIKIIDTENGLVDNTIYGILKKDNNLWLSTNRGLVKLDMKTYNMFNYDMNDGLQNNEFNIGACFKNNENILYFGGISGLTAFKEEDVLWNKNFKIELKEFSVFNEPREIKNEFELNYDENYFVLDFNMVNFNNPRTNRYKYKLKGFDDKWRESDISRVSYTKVPPGEYTLSVYGGNIYGQWGDKSTDYSIKINPPIWRSKLAYAIYVVLLLALIYLIIYLRTRYKIKEYMAKKMEEEKKAAQKLAEAKGVFLANMSHEIRTPMNGIIGCLDILSDTKLTDFQKKYVSMLKHSASALSRIINEVLEYSKLEKEDYNLEYTFFDIKQLSEEVFMMFEKLSKDKGIKLNLDIDDDMPKMIKGDDVRTRQILNNLCSNSIKFTDKGYVNIKVSIKDKKSSPKLQIIVKDTGIGMDKEALERLFNRYDQLDNSIYKKYGGTGLGLSITQKLIEKMDGTIDVESKKGDGTKITVTIPTEISEEEIQDDKKESIKLHGNVLLVEDSEITAEIMEKMLLDIGMNVDRVLDGKSALEKFELKEYDIIITDINLPKYNGIKLCEEIKSRDEKIKVIGASAVSDNNPKLQKNNIFDSFLIKPVKINKLKKELQILLKNKGNKK
ncbi:MAG: two-component regulator propeller domain-containing protein [Fusobacteriota bacterium]